MEAQPLPANDFFDFGELRESDDHRGYAKWRATSMDWEQHETCCGPEGCLERAKQRKRDDTHVYRFLVERVTEELKCDTQQLKLTALHWPEELHQSHSHVMAERLGKTAKKTVRRHLQLIAFQVLPERE